MREIKLFLFLIIISLLSSCITARKVNYLQDTSVYIPSYNDSIGYEEYVLMPTDKLFIRMYSPDTRVNTLFNGSSQQNMGLFTSSSDYSDLYTYTIKEDGTIKLPILGNISLKDHTVRQAKHKIQAAIQSTIVDECSVDVRVVGRYFSIIGSQTNGRYPISREKMNIFQALALAGDISTFGDRSSIKILRETPTGTNVSEFDVRSKEIINSDYYYIQPNDVIYIQDVPNQFFSVTSFGNALSTTFSTISFGFLIYNLAISAKEEPATETPQQ